MVPGTGQELSYIKRSSTREYFCVPELRGGFGFWFFGFLVDGVLLCTWVPGTLLHFCLLSSVYTCTRTRVRVHEYTHERTIHYPGSTSKGAVTTSQRHNTRNVRVHKSTSSEGLCATNDSTLVYEHHFIQLSTTIGRVSLCEISANVLSDLIDIF